MSVYFILNSRTSVFVRTESLTTVPQRTAVSVPLPQHTTALSSVIMSSSSKFGTLNVQGTYVYVGGYQRRVHYGDHSNDPLNIHTIMPEFSKTSSYVSN
jgi:hypothetical protein